MAEAAVSHKGKIVSIEDGKAFVEVVSQSACSSCHAAGLCGASESARKLIEVRLHAPATYSVGQEVEVCLSQKMGLKAVLLSYVIPVMILILLILFLPKMIDSELLTGICALGGVAVYYFVLYFFRSSMKDEYEFYIKG